MKSELLKIQQNEISEHELYKKLAETQKGKNRILLNKIAHDELKHYNILKQITKEDVKADKMFVLKYFLIAKLFGLSFGLKLMENSEKKAQEIYKKIAKKEKNKEFLKIMREESDHEDTLIGMIDEEKLKYVGSIVLGISDAVIELSGALAGLTLAIKQNKIIAIIGLITGIAASLSMAASEYSSKKAEEKDDPKKAALYTGTVYFITVIMLISPYVLINNPLIALFFTLVISLLIIGFFNFYISIVKGIEFKKRFFEMAVICLGVAFISFLIGMLAKYLFNVQI